jgi:hypothetical protein
MQQALPLGLVDEIRVHVIPILLGGGTPLFGSLDSSVTLERTQTLVTPAATHIGFSDDQVILRRDWTERAAAGRSQLTVNRSSSVRMIRWSAASSDRAGHCACGVSFECLVQRDESLL